MKPEKKGLTLYKPPFLVHLGHQLCLVFPIRQTNLNHFNSV